MQCSSGNAAAKMSRRAQSFAVDAGAKEFSSSSSTAGTSIEGSSSSNSASAEGSSSSSAAAGVMNQSRTYALDKIIAVGISHRGWCIFSKIPAAFLFL